MVIFQLADLDAARERAAAMGMRVVWQLDLPDISGTHLHPADTRGAIVSLDRAEPPGSWRWGGPDWTEREGTGAPGRLRGVTIAVNDPVATAERWGELLGVEPLRRGARARRLLVRFEPATRSGSPTCTSTCPASTRRVEIGGATFRLTPPD